MDRAEPVEGVEVGEIIGGYRLERLLGAGSVSRVFLGTHLRLGRRAAIKVLLTPMVDDPRVIQRFINEARVVNDIRHPNIVDVSDFIESTEPKRFALVMELIEGPSLKTLLRNGQRLTFTQAIGVALQLCAAVEAAHGAGVIHRDLKPDNLLLTSDPTEDPHEIPGLKVVDFGIAKIAGPGEKTATGMMIGTPAYMAPEQIAGKPPPSPATDVFAIGEVIYEVLTGQRAYPAGQINVMIQTKLKGDLPKLEIPAVPGGLMLKAMVERCLAQRPQDRPRIDELRRMLLEVCPEAEAAIAVDRPLSQRTGTAEEDTVEPADPYLTKPAETTEPTPLLASQLARTIPAASTSPTLHAPLTPVVHAPAEPQVATIVREPTPFDDSTTVVKPPEPATLYTPPPVYTPAAAPPKKSRLALAVGTGVVAAVLAAVTLVTMARLERAERAEKAAETPPQAEAVPAAEIVAVPRAGDFQVISEPSGATVLDAANGAELGTTPAFVARPRRVRLQKEGYEPLELDLPSAGKSMVIELTRAPEPLKDKPKKVVPKTKKADGWEW